MWDWQTFVCEGVMADQLDGFLSILQGVSLSEESDIWECVTFFFRGLEVLGFWKKYKSFFNFT